MTATEPRSSEPELSEAIACACPRCGYDQRGVVRTWTEQCPMEGTCSECGLVFAWCEVLVPEKFEPRWCVEFASRRGLLALTSLRTFVRTLFPWIFWQRLRMSHQIRWLRLVGYLAMLLAWVFVAYSIVQVAAVIVVRSKMQTSRDQFVLRIPAEIANLEAIKATQAPPSSQPLVGGQVTIDQRIAELKSWQSNPPKFEDSLVEAAVKAIVMPLEGRFRGINTMDVAPAYLYRVLFSQVVNPGWSPNMSNMWGLVSVGTAFIGASMGLMGMLPLSLVLLPVSRRRAKVRWAHIGRVWVYGLGHVISVSVVAIVLFSLGFFFPSIALEAGVCFVGWTSFGAWLVLVIWWWAAIRFYLRIPHALAISVLMTILCSIVLASGVGFAAGVFSGAMMPWE